MDMEETAPAPNTTSTADYLKLYEQQRDHITKEKTGCVTMLCVKLRKNECCVDLLARLDSLLDWLSSNVQITPTLKTECKLDKMLDLIFNLQHGWTFPQKQREQAKQLFDRWEGERWGQAIEEHMIACAQQNQATNEESEAEAEQENLPRRPTKRQKTVIETISASSTSIRRVPVDHPIYGQHGIMWGVALKSGNKRRTYTMNPECPKRDFKVFGHNGLYVGQWWAIQLAALVHGAHGSSQGGISGSQDAGAYSIVISSVYDDLDRDCGDVIHYSGSDSHDNKNPNATNESSRGTKALRSSISTGKPVRVLRSASGQSKYCPSIGIRYDGLYQVVSLNDKQKNGHGGLYEQFKLKRLPDQLSLGSIVSPTGAQIRDYGQIEMEY